MNPKRLRPKACKTTAEKLEQRLIDIRLKKIAKLKSKVHAGRYRVSTQDLAKALFLSC